jgi:hypothetical protein
MRVTPNLLQHPPILDYVTEMTVGICKIRPIGLIFEPC